MIETHEIEQQLREAAQQLEAAAAQIRKARKATDDQDPLVAQCAIIREATAKLIMSAQGLHVVIGELEERTQYLVDD